MNSEAILQQAQDTLRIEADAVAALIPRLGEGFVRAVEMLLATPGRAILTGVGKSGAIATKLAATLASTGTPSAFMHPTDAAHGDLGMITERDVVIALSQSGESDELSAILPAIKRRGAQLIVICGNPDSTLAHYAEVYLDAAVAQEACPLGLAPTASTAAALALGDALAMATMVARGVTVEDFAVCHPAGTLGRRVLLRVQDIMHAGADNPTIPETTTVLEALIAMSKAAVRGAVSVVDEAGHLRGFFTDGDLRVLLQKATDREQLMSAPIASVMTTHPTTAGPDMLAAAAAHLMQEREFDNVPVVDADGMAVGVLDIQDLVKAGLA
ncbi:MAG TPA: KpsF/GutQ family sugar-phosphate isomerase [Armatimonadota bacterium]|jgi:arabinose-5-phosphate isomerase